MTQEQVKEIRDRYLALAEINQMQVKVADLRKLELRLEGFDYDRASGVLAAAERAGKCPQPRELLAELAQAEGKCDQRQIGENQEAPQEQILVAEIVAKDQIDLKVAWKYASIYAAAGTARGEVEEKAQEQAQKLSAIYGKEMIVRYYHMDDSTVVATAQYGPIRGFPDLEKQPDPIHEIIRQHKPPLEVWKTGGKDFDWDAWEAQVEEDIRQWILGYLGQRAPDLAIPEKILAEGIHQAHKQQDHPARWLVARLLAYRDSSRNREEGLWRGPGSTI